MHSWISTLRSRIHCRHGPLLQNSHQHTWCQGHLSDFIAMKVVADCSQEEQVSHLLIAVSKDVQELHKEWSVCVADDPAVPCFGGVWMVMLRLYPSLTFLRWPLWIFGSASKFAPFYGISFALRTLADGRPLLPFCSVTLSQWANM